MAGQLTIDTLKASSGVLATQNGMTGIAKAWVNFDGTTGTINGAFNVSSITVNGTGDYTLNFTTALANANYSVATTCFVIADQGSAYQFGYYVAAGGSPTTAPTTKTTTALRMLCRRDSTVNIQNASVSIFGA